MKTLYKLMCFLAVLFFLPGLSPACTTAVLSGRCTPDGRPLLWKNRDTGHLQNRLVFFKDGKYEYIGLVNTHDKKGEKVWAGMNETGFAIMNSNSYNLNPEDSEVKVKDRDGFVMKAALQTCKTVHDFEKLLKGQKKPMGLETNFGVIDAKGNAAYFEVSNFTYIKIDANDPKQAPEGFLIRSNHSLTGREDDGTGYIRCQMARKIFLEALKKNDLTPRFLAQDASRCLRHGLTNRNLYDEAKKLSKRSNRFFFFRDYIPRQSSSSVSILQGVKPGEDPKLGTVWTVLGFPLTAAIVPTWVAVGPDLPKILQGNPEQPAPMCDLAMNLKAICFPITRGSGPYYLELAKLINRDETGILQRLEPVENSLLEKVNPMLKNWTENGFKADEAKVFYRWVDKEWFDDLKKVSDNRKVKR